jgi:hypothetical protein
MTPARIAAAIGVVSGLAATIAALADLLPKESGVGKALVAVGGLLTTGITLAKWLEGQAGWEQQQDLKPPVMPTAPPPVIPIPAPPESEQP